MNRCDRCGSEGRLVSRLSGVWLCRICDAGLPTPDASTLVGQDVIRKYLLDVPKTHAQRFFQETGIEPQSGEAAQDLASLNKALTRRYDETQGEINWVAVTGGLPADSLRRAKGLHPTTVRVPSEVIDQLAADLCRAVPPDVAEGLAEGVRDGQFDPKRVKQIIEKGQYSPKEAQRQAARMAAEWG